MAHFTVLGPTRLCGQVHIARAKNAVLPQMAAALMTAAPCTLEQVPDLTDVTAMAELLRGLGATVQRGKTAR